MSTITFYSVFGYDLKSMVLRVSIPLTLLPKPFASDIDMNDKGFGTCKETLEKEEVDLGFGKYKFEWRRRRW